MSPDTRRAGRTRRHGAALTFLLLGLAGAADAQEHAHHEKHEMPGLLGPSMGREASGTSWQPEAAGMPGMHIMGDDWMLMVHGYADLVYDDQGGPRGDEQVVVPSMLMAMGRSELGPGALGARAMVSLDPLMGRAGYPLLFQTGETADGRSELVDRQHPHDAFMELAGTYSVSFGEHSVFAYAGLPGEPALGPPAFMHRASGVEIPEAPLTHHWLDSTHITFGVLTLGTTSARWKAEGSWFNGHEPDQHRWNVETRSFDSAAGRITWNPAPAWSLQASHGYLAEPEQLDPGVAVHRTTASVSHHDIVAGGFWSTTVAVGANRSGGHAHAGALAEITRRFAERNVLFTRVDWIETDHLFDAGPLAGREFAITKLSAGGSRDLVRGAHVALSAGALGSIYHFPDELDAAYGAHPVSVMLFVRLSIA